MDEDELYAMIASMLPDYDMTPEEEKQAYRGWSYNDDGDEVASTNGKTSQSCRHHRFLPH